MMPRFAVVTLSSFFFFFFVDFVMFLFLGLDTATSSMSISLLVMDQKLPRNPEIGNTSV